MELLALGTPEASVNDSQVRLLPTADLFFQLNEFIQPQQSTGGMFFVDSTRRVDFVFVSHSLRDRVAE
jgi:hypothetical protein